MNIDITGACAAWAALEAAVGPLSAAPTTANAERMNTLMHQLLDSMRTGTTAPGADRLLDFLTEWVTAYEDAQVQIPTCSPVDLLRHLMECNNLKQRDLAAELGGQPNVSAVLNGHRQINPSQAARLGRRFKLSPLAFLPHDTAVQPAARPLASITAGHARSATLGVMTLEIVQLHSQQAAETLHYVDV